MSASTTSKDPNQTRHKPVPTVYCVEGLYQSKNEELDLSTVRPLFEYLE